MYNYKHVSATTTTTKATPTGGESISFISGDNGGDTQYVGYPGFISLQNSVPMPIATGNNLFNHFLRNLVSVVTMFWVMLLP